MSMKTLSKGKVVNSVLVNIPVELSSDFDRRRNGSIMMAATNATFNHNGEQGHISVDVGGTVLEVGIGSRRWHVKLADIVPAILEMDEEYVIKNPVKLKRNPSDSGTFESDSLRKEENNGL